jgi:hypothetical protein
MCNAISRVLLGWIFTLLLVSAGQCHAATFGEAVWGGHKAAVVKMLAKGADPNQRIHWDEGSYEGSYPLEVAAFYCDTAMVRVLLEGGANPQLGFPVAEALRQAYRSTHPLTPDKRRRVVETLLDAGASPDTGDGMYKLGLPLDMAIDDADAELVRLLIDHGATPGTREVQLACEANRADIAELLLAHGADPNVGKVMLRCVRFIVPKGVRPPTRSNLLINPFYVDLGSGPRDLLLIRVEEAPVTHAAPALRSVLCRYGARDSLSWGTGQEGIESFMWLVQTEQARTLELSGNNNAGTDAWAVKQMVWSFEITEEKLATWETRLLEQGVPEGIVRYHMKREGAPRGCDGGE